MSANLYRGEAEVELFGDEPIALRPTFAALVAAEAELGPLFDLIEKSARGELRLTEMIALFWHCRAHPEEWDDRDVFADVLTRAGLVRMTPALKAITGQILLGR